MRYHIKKHGSGYWAFAGNERITTTVNKNVALSAIRYHKKQLKIRKIMRKNGWGY